MSPRRDRRSPMRESWRDRERERDIYGGRMEDEYDMRQGHWNIPPPGMGEPPYGWHGAVGGGGPPPPGNLSSRSGRKTLLNTPPVPVTYGGGPEGNQGPPRYGGYPPEKGYDDAPDGSYGPPMHSSHPDSYPGPHPHPLPDMYGGPPPPARGGSGWGNEPGSGAPPSKLFWEGFRRLAFN